MATERYALEHPGDWAESRILARASFLNAILRHRPNVIQDLWTAVLPEFKRAVATRYCSQITEGLDLEDGWGILVSQRYVGVGSTGDRSSGTAKVS